MRWKTVSCAAVLGEFGYDLHAACARADDRDPLAGQVDGRIPPRVCMTSPEKSASPSMSGYRHGAEQSDSADDDVSDDQRFAPSLASSTSQCCASSFQTTLRTEVPSIR